MIDKRVLLSNSKNRITDAKSYATKIAVLKTLKKEKVFKSLSFHNRISNAKKFSEEIIKTNDELSSKNKLGSNNSASLSHSLSLIKSILSPVLNPVSYTHLTLPTKRIV